MGDVRPIPSRVPPGSRFAAEHYMGGVAGFAVIYGPAQRGDPLAHPERPTWLVAIRTRGQPDQIILDCTYDPAKGPFSEVQSTVRDFAGIALQTLMHAAVNPAAFGDERGAAS